MKRLFASVLTLAWALPGAAAEPRPPLKGVSAVRVANYQAPSRLVQERQQVRSILEELGELRKRSWSRADHTTMRCYSTVLLMSGAKPLTTFRVLPQEVVEVHQLDRKRQAAYGLRIAEGDLPTLKRLLTEVAPAKGCE